MTHQPINTAELIFPHFFAAPNEDRAGQPMSVLYLLRRDAAQCFGYDPNTFEVTANQEPIEDGRQVLWPGAMTVFAGVDLLSKFNASTDQDQIPAGTQPTDHWRFSVTGRFRTFVSQYFNIDANSQEEDLIYQLRNALDHSFALWARRRNDGQVFRFTLARLHATNSSTLLEQRTETTGEIECIIYLYELHRRFERGLQQFSAQLLTRLQQSQVERTAFEQLVERYGFIGIAHATQFGWN